MVTARQRLAAALRITDHLPRQMAIAAIICHMFRDAGEIAVMVGGSAVEFYTAAQYVTKDIDFIGGSPARIRAIMDELGFVNRGGTWVLPENPSVVVEFPKGPLAGAYDKVQSVRMDNGDTAEVIGLEDIIVDRVAASKFWGDGSEEMARYIALARYNEIDWKYCLNAAATAECAQEVLRLREWSRRQRRKIARETSATYPGQPRQPTSS